MAKIMGVLQLVSSPLPALYQTQSGGEKQCQRRIITRSAFVPNKAFRSDTVKCKIASSCPPLFRSEFPPVLPHAFRLSVHASFISRSIEGTIFSSTEQGRPTTATLRQHIVRCVLHFSCQKQTRGRTCLRYSTEWIPFCVIFIFPFFVSCCTIDLYHSAMAFDEFYLDWDLGWTSVYRRDAARVWRCRSTIDVKGFK